MVRYVIAVVRILIGASFLWLGISKLLDPELLYGGLFHELEKHGAAFPFYQRFLSRYVELHQELFAFAAAGGEVLVGLSFLLGALVSLASVGGAFLMLNFGFAISFGNQPSLLLHVAFALGFLLIGRLGAGLAWGLDGWLAQRIAPAWVLFPLRRSLPRWSRGGS